MTQRSEQASDTAGLVRVSAHDLRQPLSTIESIAYYLGLILPQDDPRVHEHLAKIEQLVGQCDWILASTLQLIEEQGADRETLDLEELIAQTLAARASTGEQSPTLQFAGGLPQVTLKAGGARAVIDIAVPLFHQIADDADGFTIATEPVAGAVGLSFSTTTGGYGSPGALGNGSGLALDALRRIAESGGGSFELDVHPETGVRLRLMLL